MGFLVLIGWQFIAFGTANYPTFERSNIYYHSGHNIVLQVLNVIELIWGMQFLRDACNFFVNFQSTLLCQETPSNGTLKVSLNQGIALSLLSDYWQNTGAVL